MQQLDKLSTSRIQIPAILAGISLTLAIMFFSMSFAAALGFWFFRQDEVNILGPQFWIVAISAWSLSVFVGSVFVVLASRTKHFLDGLINSLVAWSGSYLIFGGLTLAVVKANAVLDMHSTELFVRAFIGDGIALIMCVLGAWLGLYFENESIKFQIRRVARTSYRPSSGLFENATH